jgi:hypothetical protein
MLATVKSPDTTGELGRTALDRALEERGEGGSRALAKSWPGGISRLDTASSGVPPAGACSHARRPTRVPTRFKPRRRGALRHNRGPVRTTADLEVGRHTRRSTDSPTARAKRRAALSGAPGRHARRRESFTAAAATVPPLRSDTREPVRIGSGADLETNLVRFWPWLGMLRD